MPQKSNIPIHARFTRLGIIGEGSFGKVYKGLDNERREPVAIKVLNLENDPEGIEEIAKEINVLSNCSHPNIIRYYGSWMVGSQLWIIMDYCAAGSLQTLIKNHPNGLSEKCVLFVAKQILMTLAYLHRNGIIHRDIKAANVFLTTLGHARLGDFGVAAGGQGVNDSDDHENNATRSGGGMMVGSPYWMAPEVIQRKSYDSKADIWSFGITLYEILTGKPPLASLSPSEAIHVIPQKTPPRLDTSFSVEMQRLVESCLDDDPTRRPSAAELLQTKLIRKISTTKSPLISILDHVRARDVHDEKGPEPGTVASGWTFGTFNSKQYQRYTTVNGDDFDGGDFAKMSLSSSTSPPPPLHNKNGGGEPQTPTKIRKSKSNLSINTLNTTKREPLYQQQKIALSFQDSSNPLTIFKNEMKNIPPKMIKVVHKDQSLRDSIRLLLQIGQGVRFTDGCDEEYRRYFKEYILLLQQELEKGK